MTDAAIRVALDRVLDALASSRGLTPIEQYTGLVAAVTVIRLAARDGAAWPVVLAAEGRALEVALGALTRGDVPALLEALNAVSGGADALP